MNLLDIVGPVMVGPSSSHTAGAVKMGNVCRKLLGEEVKHAKIIFHGSFLATGKGHGTDRAVVAGLLGFAVDDIRIPNSFEIAPTAGMTFEISGADLGDVHPNTTKFILTGQSGKTIDVEAASVGGGQIMINKIDGLSANFSGNYPTLLVHNEDKPGFITEISSVLTKEKINIATMQVYRDRRGGNAVMVLEVDQEVPEDGIHWLEELEGIVKVTYLSLDER